MLDVIKPLLDSELINEEAKEEIQEAWKAKVAETRELVGAELREEFAQRYEHDKQNMVEAIDRMVTESLTTEIEAVKSEKSQLAEDRVKFNAQMKESAKKFDSFLVKKLAEEIQDLREDRKQQKVALKTMEQFVMKALAKEITEFAEDKKDVIETKVRLVAEAREKLEALKEKFISESASKMTTAVAKHLKAELSQLHEDIKVARENSFGRKIFEAFASEFVGTHLNENEEIRKLKATIEGKDQQLQKTTAKLDETNKLVESKDKEVNMIKDKNVREAKLTELLSPLNAEKEEVMRNLLESVQTTRLDAAFEKYLPAVLSEDVVKSKKTKLTESVKEVTGDKASQEKTEEDTTNVIDIRRLAGL